MKGDWKLMSKKSADGHPLIMESTTETVACGYSWCTGSCGFPAFILEIQGKTLKAYGSMVACGLVFQSWRVEWVGKTIPVTLGDMSIEKALKRLWV